MVNGRSIEAEVSGGYAELNRLWRPGDRVDLTLPMEAQRVYADDRVTADRGRVALQRGPIVFNVEDVDHFRPVRPLVLKPDAALETNWKGDLLGGVMVIKGRVLDETNEVDLMATPNFTRLNRTAAGRL